MSLNPRILQSIQQAGQSIHDCRELLKAEVSRHTEQLVSVMASQPLGPSADSAFSQLKQVARIHQEMQALEEQLRGIYQSAAQIKGEEVQVIEALPHRRASTATAAVQVEDAQVIQKSTGREQRKAKAGKPGKPSANAPQRKQRGGRVSTNDEKVLTALRRLLKVSKNAVLSQAQIATEAGIPGGSIAASIRRLQDAGAVQQMARGQYRLS